MDLELRIYDVSGRLIDTLVSGSLEAGAHGFEWSGTDRVGGRVAPGVYLVRLTANGGLRTEKVVRVE
jgi:flagellar basal-body rod modification protein FlgD